MADGDALAGQGFVPQPAKARQKSRAIPGARFLLNLFVLFNLIQGAGLAKTK
jgi:hypothetical protein